MITKILSRRVGVFPLVSIVPMMFCKQRQIALVSAKVIEMIANE
jgi:hypothetical protein